MLARAEGFTSFAVAGDSMESVESAPSGAGTACSPDPPGAATTYSPEAAAAGADGTSAGGPCLSASSCNHSGGVRRKDV